MIYAITDETDMGPFEKAGKLFFEECNLLGDFDYEFFLNSWQSLMDAGLGKIWIREDGDGNPVGALGGVAMPDMFTGEIVVTASFWYVLPSHRGNRASVQLVGALQNWAKHMNANRIVMDNLRTHSNSRSASFFKALGFEEMETHYWKNIE